jgi:hypothetical protein
MEILKFPHRQFLGGCVTLKELLHEAIQSAISANESIAEVVAKARTISNVPTSHRRRSS